MYIFLALMLIWWLIFMPSFFLYLFCSEIHDWIKAKTEEIRERTIKLRNENRNDNNL